MQTATEEQSPDRSEPLQIRAAIDLLLRTLERVGSLAKHYQEGGTAVAKLTDDTSRREVLAEHGLTEDELNTIIGFFGMPRVMPESKVTELEEAKKPKWNSFDYITLRLQVGEEYGDACAYLPQNGIRDFWDALGVEEDAEEKLQSEWMKGNMVPVAPDFPVLSTLIQMQIDHSSINATYISNLIDEIAVGRQKCVSPFGLAAFDALAAAANLALAEDKGISLSPFG